MYNRWYSLAFCSRLYSRRTVYDWCFVIDKNSYPQSAKRNIDARWFNFVFAQFVGDAIALNAKQLCWWWRIRRIGNAAVWWRWSLSVPTNMAYGTTKCGIVCFGITNRRICVIANMVPPVAINAAGSVDGDERFEPDDVVVVVKYDVLSFVDWDQVNTVSPPSSLQ